VLWRLKSPEVGRSFNAGKRVADFALVCDFANREALAAYHRHPAHAETRAVVDPYIAEHWIADYEL
jgi:stress responsive alpha/beta barrel protein